MTESTLAGDLSTVAVVRGPADLVELMPYLIGFHPTHSVVIAEIRRGRLGAVLRADLPSAPDETGFAAGAAARLSRVAADGAVLVVYAEAGDDRSSRRPLVRAVDAALRAARIPLHDALYVGGGRWWSFFCTDPDCCPPSGSAVPRGAVAPPTTTAVAVAGMAAFPDRRSLERSLEPASGAGAEAMRAALRRAETRAAEQVAAAGGMALWRRAARYRFGVAAGRVVPGRRRDGSGSGWLTDDAAADLLVSLVDVHVRDDCWRRLDRRRGSASRSWRTRCS